MRTIQNRLFWAFLLFSGTLGAQTEEALQNDQIYQKPARINIPVPERVEEDTDLDGKPRRAVAVSKMVEIPAAQRNAARWNNARFQTGDVAIIPMNESVTEGTRAAAGACTVPKVESDLLPIYSAVKAHMPIYLPYRNTKVGIWQGFYYNWEDKHGAIDYGKGGIAAGEDPTFYVYAVASGKVIDVKWSNGGGNIVTIEHTAPNGKKYRSTYLHLRNGFSNDLANAKNSPSAKYKAFAKSAGPSALCWGTNSQKILVKKNDNVSAGQLIAYAGNTGSGGIGIILNDDGTLKNPDTRSFNVHLHFEMRVPDTRSGHSGEWVLVDPYGTYAKADVDCYDLDSETPFERLFAPFYPNYHNIPLKYVNKFWGYYTGMGMALQTISIQKDGELLASGSFQWGLSNQWYARFYMTSDQYQQYFNQYDGQGFRPRQLNVSMQSGEPRFTAIWEKKPAGQNWTAYHNRDDANFNALWKDYVETKKWHVSEHVTYTHNGKRLHAGVLVNKPGDNGFYMFYGMSPADFDKKFKELYDKWEMTSAHVNGGTVGGVWRPKKNNYAMYYGMTPADYQTKFNQFSAQGLRLIKIQSYGNSDKFAAIWSK